MLADNQDFSLLRLNDYCFVVHLNIADDDVKLISRLGFSRWYFIIINRNFVLDQAVNIVFVTSQRETKWLEIFHLHHRDISHVRNSIRILFGCDLVSFNSSRNMIKLWSRSTTLEKKTHKTRQTRFRRSTTVFALSLVSCWHRCWRLVDSANRWRDSFS